MFIVAGFFAVVALIGVLIGMLEVAAWSNGITPSQSSIGGVGFTIFLIAGVYVILISAAAISKAIEALQ